MKATDFLWVYVTAKDVEEARTLAQGALRERLAACVNLLGEIESYYPWEGSLEVTKEFALIFKTRRNSFEELSEWIVENHSYECPCVLALPITGGNQPYLTWLSEAAVADRK